MRILIDTNVWVSALLWPDSLPSRVLQMIIRDHTVILSAEIIGELRDVYTRKFSHKLPDFERFLEQLTYELATEKPVLARHLTIRDPNDVHVLIAAISSNADILLTGDQDFAELPMTKPMIMTSRQFVEKYMS